MDINIKEIFTEEELKYHRRNSCRTNQKYLEGFRNGFDYALEVIEKKLKEKEN